MLTSIKQWMRSYPLIVALIALVVGTGTIQLVTGADSLAQMGLLRMGLTALMIVVVVLAGGAAIFRLKPGVLGYSLKKSIYPLLIVLVLGALSLFFQLSQIQSGETELATNWPMLLLAAAFLCIFVGLFEELLFRAIVFDALAARLGSTKKGIILAMVISALIFGVVHIGSALFGGIDINSVTLLQMLLKTLQVALLGLLLAAIYLKTRSIWGVALVHALNDYFLTAPNSIFNSVPGRTYVMEGETGAENMYILAGMLVFSIPFIFMALKILKTTSLPAETIFTDTISSKNALEKS